jgi:predicted transcriptional regulator
MKVVWERGEATVNDVLAAQDEPRQLAYNTILTTLRILEQKGYVDHSKNGRAHVYRPLVDRQQARRRAVRHMLSSFFDNSPEALMLNLLNDESLTKSELKRLKNMIDKGKTGKSD